MWIKYLPTPSEMHFGFFFLSLPEAVLLIALYNGSLDLDAARSVLSNGTKIYDCPYRPLFWTALQPASTTTRSACMGDRRVPGVWVLELEE